MKEKIKAIWKILFSKEYIVFTTDSDYSNSKVNKISCFIMSNNSSVFNESCHQFLGEHNNRVKFNTK